MPAMIGFTDIRKGVSSIELMIVISIATILASIAVPGVMSAVQRGAVNQGLDAVQSLASQAQSLARRSYQDPASPQDYRFGIALVQEGGEAFAVLLRGQNANDEYLDAGGNPVRRLPLGHNTVIWSASDPAGSNQAVLSGRIAWFYDFGTGRPVAWDSSAAPARFRETGIGTPAAAAQGRDMRFISGGDAASFQTFALQTPAVPASTVCTHLSLRSRDQRYRFAVTVYQLGLFSSVSW
jgi:Tfp pilus assembly protein FimT